MNIYALDGHKVIVKSVTITKGNEASREKAEKHLVSGNIYTVKFTYVNNSYTSVCLKEFPDILFNSVFFEDIDFQPEESDMKHPDWDNRTDSSNYKNEKY